MNKKKLIWQLPFLAFLIIGTILIIKNQAPYQTDQGLAFGTVYKVTYQSDDNLKNDIEDALKNVNSNFSMFNKSSIISKVNLNEDIKVNEEFIKVFNLAQKVSKETDGAYDITVAPLVNIWGFGFKSSKGVDSASIDSILKFVGNDKVVIKNAKVIKKDSRAMLDFSSIAKGYGVDAVAMTLERKGVKNYMIDIGGEVVVKGKNPKMKSWRIGINKPIDDSLSVNQELQTILEISDIGMATSGNYRNFYYKGGKKYAHTIDPRNGYPVQHSILSATVIAKDCATADAYATAFMVIGKEKAIKLCDAHPELDAYFICDNHKGGYEIVMTDGMKRYIVNE